MFRVSSYKSRAYPSLNHGAGRKVASIIKTAVNVTPGGGVATPGGIRTPTTIRNQTGNPLMDNSLIDSWIPLDNMGLHQLWRRIYLRDSICGSAVDFWRELPWSDFTLGGVDDKSILDVYNHCLKDKLKVLTWLPEITAEFLALGKVCVHGLFDQSDNIFTDVIIHNPDHIEVAKSPLHNAPIKVDLKPIDEHLNWINSTDPRDIAARNTVDKSILRLLAANQPIPLDPKNTVYVPRRAFAYDVDGMSIFSRAIYFIALERPLFTASILASRRRAGPMTQIQAGSEDWEPTPPELDSLAQAFIEAEEDAVSAVMVTRNDVNVNRAISSIAGDLWKISDEYQFITEGKMKALGINDALLSGEATYSTTEMALSITLERIRSHRQFITQMVLEDWICKETARAHGFVKRTQAQLDHGVRVASDDLDDEKLQIPTFNWHKQLRPTADDQAISLLTTAEEKGLPVTIRDWAGTTGFQLEEAMKNLEEDQKIRAKIWTHKQQIAKFQGGGEEGGGGGFDAMMGGGDAGGSGGDEGQGQPAAASVTKRQASIHKAVHSDAIRKFVLAMPIWDSKGMCIDMHKEEIIEKMHDPDFLTVLAQGHGWKRLGEYVTHQYQWSPRKVQVFGYTLFRMGLVRNYEIPQALVTELAERVRKEGSGKSESLGLIRELQFLSTMSRKRRQDKPEIGATISSIASRDRLVTGAELLTGKR